MAKSTYYFEIYKTDAVAIRNQDLMGEIQEIFKKNKGRYGVRRVHRELLNRGHKVNHKRVQRLMHTMELKGKRPKLQYYRSTSKMDDRCFPVQSSMGQMLSVANLGYEHQ